MSFLTSPTVQGGVFLRLSTGSMFEGSSLKPSLDTIRPRNMTSHLNSLHLFCFNLSPCSFNLDRTFLRCCKWSSKVALKTMISSRYGMHMVSLRSPRQVSMNLWKQAGALLSPKGILTHSYNPHRVMNTTMG